MRDIEYSNLPESRRHAIILWEMLDRPLGNDGIRILQTAVEQTTPQQVRDLLAQL